jgi:hypothetical protein
MKLGISIGNFSWPVPVTGIGPTLSRLARTADDAGIDSLWVMDHFFQIRLTGQKTIASTFDPGDDPKAALPGLLAHFRELAALGIDHVLVSPSRPWDEEILAALASAVPDVHGIEAAP